MALSPCTLRMTSEIRIRPERADHPQVAPLLQALDAYLASLYAPEDNHILDVQALLQPDVDFLVAERGAEFVGCGATRRMSGEADTEGQVYGEIKRMYVVPAYRNRGIGKIILTHLEQWAKEENFKISKLETGIKQPEAIAAYKKSGYIHIPNYPPYVDMKESICMMKNLQ